MKSQAAPEIAAEAQAMLRHWLEAVPNDRLAHLIRDAARGLGRSLQMRLTDHAVSFGHWAFLRVLWEHDGLTQSELSARVGVMEPTAFAAVRALQKLGYVTRRQKSTNRKNLYVHLTPAGASLKAKLVPLAEQVNQIALAGVGAADIAITRQTLLTMIRNLAREEAAATADERRLPSTRAVSRMRRKRL
ncbi:MAG TPA: MarR family transcriptional regulator [Stellaceae bacterium]|jgi:DNA-binding MarR family transcriptional regulator|nr:MarR family transcriptional regulator [Stellaceae bacterium]